MIRQATGRHAVHPHARGEHTQLVLLIAGAYGPPPRAWGTRLRHRGGGRSQRSTPTRVGNTRHAGERPPGGAVHPHARGEHVAQRLADAWNSGPPPRAWGTHACRDVGPHALRSTPTRVGNTPRSARSRRPRYGPPPRAWGTPWRRSRTPWLGRSTPTRVGNTSYAAWSCGRATVHPHARGEHAWQLSPAPVETGPPPRAWGTLTTAVRVCVWGRSTPTRVGNTLSETEKLQRRRSTPTRVGNTARAGEPQRLEAVHPHARGEHVSSLRCACWVDGPPPRAWGTRAGRQPAIALVRSTPTRVGNTCWPG